MDFSQILVSSIAYMGYAKELPPPMPKGRKIVSVVERFWPKVDKQGPLYTDREILKIWPEIYNTRCHDWIPCKGENKYGFFGDSEKIDHAHRVIWILINGPIPEGLEVCHKCDRKCCVNIEHLYLGTHLENMKDRDKKGRVARGEKSGRARYKEKIIIEILVDWATGKYSTYTLGKKYKVSPGNIWYIVTRKKWKHVKV